MKRSRVKKSFGALAIVVSVVICVLFSIVQTSEIEITKPPVMTNASGQALVENQNFYTTEKGQVVVQPGDNTYLPNASTFVEAEVKDTIAKNDNNKKDDQATDVGFVPGSDDPNDIAYAAMYNASRPPLSSTNEIDENIYWALDDNTHTLYIGNSTRKDTKTETGVDYQVNTLGEANVPGWFLKIGTVINVEIVDPVTPNKYTKSWFSTANATETRFASVKITSIKGLGNINMTNVEDCSFMFCGIGYSNPNYFPVNMNDSYWQGGTLNIDNAINTTAMFCLSNVNAGFAPGSAIDVRSNGENLTNTYSMFQQCKISLPESAQGNFDLSNFNMQNVASASYMFNNLSGVSKIKTGQVDSSKLTEARSMFCGLPELAYLDLTTWNNNPTGNFKNMFANSPELTTIMVANDTDWTGVSTNSTNMFAWSMDPNDPGKIKALPKLKGGLDSTVVVKASWDKTNARVDGGTTADTENFPGYFTTEYVLTPDGTTFSSNTTQVKTDPVVVPQGCTWELSETNSYVYVKKADNIIATFRLVIDDSIVTDDSVVAVNLKYEEDETEYKTGSKILKTTVVGSEPGRPVTFHFTSPQAINYVNPETTNAIIHNEDKFVAKFNKEFIFDIFKNSGYSNWAVSKVYLVLNGDTSHKTNIHHIEHGGDSVFPYTIPPIDPTVRQIDIYLDSETDEGSDTATLQFNPNGGDIVTDEEENVKWWGDDNTTTTSNIAPMNTYHTDGNSNSSYYEMIYPADQFFSEGQDEYYIGSVGYKVANPSQVPADSNQKFKVWMFRLSGDGSFTKQEYPAKSGNYYYMWHQPWPDWSYYTTEATVEQVGCEETGYWQKFVLDRPYHFYVSRDESHVYKNLVVLIQRNYAGTGSYNSSVPQYYVTENTAIGTEAYASYYTGPTSNSSEYNNPSKEKDDPPSISYPPYGMSKYAPNLLLDCNAVRYADWQGTGIHKSHGGSPVVIPVAEDKYHHPNPDKKKIFDGWWTQPKGGEEVIKPDNETVNIAVPGYTDAYGNWIINSDKTLYAHWKDYTVTFNDDGNIDHFEYDGQNYHAGDQVTVNKDQEFNFKVFNKQGFVVDSVTANGTTLTPSAEGVYSTTITSNTTINATAVKPIPINWYANGGTWPSGTDPQTTQGLFGKLIDDSQKVSQTPIYDGHYFGKVIDGKFYEWFKEADANTPWKFDQDTIQAPEHQDLYAGWRDTNTTVLNFKDTSDGLTGFMLQNEEGDWVDKGKDFSIEETNGNNLKFKVNVADNYAVTKVVAKYGATEVELPYIFDDNGYYQITVPATNMVDINVTVEQGLNYRPQLNLNANGGYYDTTSTTSKDVYPQFGTSDLYNAQSMSAGEVIPMPVPQKYAPNSKFDGFYLGTEDTSAKVMNDDGTLIAGIDNLTSSEGKWILKSSTATTLYAHWIQGDMHTVSFEMNDHGTQVDPQNVEHNGLATEPPTPTDETMRFAGWYANEELVDPVFDFNNTRILTDLTLYAKWVTKDETNVTVHKAEHTEGFSVNTGEDPWPKFEEDTTFVRHYNTEFEFTINGVESQYAITNVYAQYGGTQHTIQYYSDEDFGSYRFNVPEIQEDIHVYVTLDHSTTTPALTFDGNGGTYPESSDVTVSSYYGCYDTTVASPFATTTYYSTSEAIYDKSLISKTGNIDSIFFYIPSKYTGTVSGCTIKLWLFETDKTSFSSTTDWFTSTYVTSTNYNYYGSSKVIGSDTGGWQEFKLTKSVAFSGNKNLGLVASCSHNGTSSSTLRFGQIPVADSKGILQRNSSDSDTYADPTSTSTAGRTGSSNPYIKLSISNSPTQKTGYPKFGENQLYTSSTYETTMDIPIPTRTASPTNFDGYWTTASGDGVQVVDKDGKIIPNVAGYTNAEGKWLVKTASTLYARWKTYQITLNGDDNIDHYESNGVNYKLGSTLNFNYNESFVFKVYAKDGYAVDTVKQDGVLLTPAADGTYTTPIKTNSTFSATSVKAVELDWHANGGYWGSPGTDQQITWGKGGALVPNDQIPADPIHSTKILGKVIDNKLYKWFTDEEAETPWHFDSDTLPEADNQHFYAGWRDVSEHIVNFHMNNNLDKYTLFKEGEDPQDFTEDFVVQENGEIKFNVTSKEGYAISKVNATYNGTTVELPYNEEKQCYTFDSTDIQNADISVELVQGPATPPVLTLNGNGGMYNGLIDKSVGTGTEKNGNNAPMNNYYRYSTNETIYPGTSIGKTGLIESISYNVQNASKVVCDDFRIYIGTRNTAVFSGTTDWQTSYQLVYSRGSANGKPNQVIGSYTGVETYKLDTPYNFTSTLNNLVVIVCKHCASYSNALKYYHTATTDSTNKCMYRQIDSGDTAYTYTDPSYTGTNGTFLANNTYPNITFGFSGSQVASVNRYPGFGTNKIYYDKQYSTEDFPIPTKTAEPNLFDGYETSTGVKVVNADGSLVPNVAGFTNNRGEWILTSDATLRAKWKYPTFNVDFNMNGHGEQIPSQEVVKYQKVIKPTDPTAEGYKFAGWYTNQECEGMTWDFNTGVTSDMTLYAKWIDTDEAMLNFNESTGLSKYSVNGGAELDPGFNLVSKQGDTVTFNATAADNYAVTGAHAVYGGESHPITFDTENEWFSFTVPAYTVVDIYVDTAQKPSTAPKLTFDGNGGKYESTIDYIQYGDDISTSSSNKYPIHSFDRHSTVEIIYPGSAIGSCTIKSLAFDCKSIESQDTSTDQFDIYLGTTTKSSFNEDTDNSNDWIYSANLTKVYSGTPDFGRELGYDSNKFNFNVSGHTSYIFNRGTSNNNNLVVVICKSLSAYGFASFKTSTTTGDNYAVKYVGSDSGTQSTYTTPDSTHLGTLKGTRVKNELPNIRLYKDTGGEPILVDSVQGYPKFGTDELYNNSSYSGDPIAMPIPAKEDEPSIFNGYETADGTLVVNPDGTIIPNVAGYTNMYGKWIVDANKTLKARWRNAIFDVSFDVQGHGTAPDTQHVIKGQPATRPADPTDSGWTFIDWYDNAECTGLPYDFSTPITGDKILYAKWIEESNTAITFHIDTGVASYTIDGVTHTELFSVTKAQDSTAQFKVAAANDYAITGVIAVYDDESHAVNYNQETGFFEFVVPVNVATVDIHAQTTHKPATAPQITFNGNGGKFGDQETTTAYSKFATDELYDNASCTGDPIDMPVPVKTTAQTKFDGYYTAETGGTKVMDADGTLQANVEGCTNMLGQWILQNNIPLYAHWTTNDNVSVHFNMNDHGTQIPDATIEKGTFVTRPTDPTETGFHFMGWYDNSSLEEPKFDFENTPIMADTTLYAKWVNEGETVVSLHKADKMTSFSVNTGESEWPEYDHDVEFTREHNSEFEFTINGVADKCAVTNVKAVYGTTEFTIPYYSGESFGSYRFNVPAVYETVDVYVTIEQSTATPKMTFNADGGTFGSGTCEIGNSSSTSNTYNYPMNTYYQYSICEMIYPGDKLGDCTISSLAFDVYNTLSRTETTLKIYLGTTTATSFGGASVSGSNIFVTDVERQGCKLTQVYSGSSIGIGSTKGYSDTFNFSESYNFVSKSGSTNQNLVVVVCKQDSAYDKSTLTYKNTSDTNYVCAYAQSDTVSSYLTPNSTNASSWSLSAPKYLPNIKFGVKKSTSQAYPKYGTDKLYSSSSYGTEMNMPVPTKSTSPSEFEGYWTDKNGRGSQVMDYNGNLIPNVSGYTNAEGKWIATADKTVYAYWVTAHQKKVTFDLQGKGANFNQLVPQGSKATKPTDPTAVGYNFAGWYETAECEGLPFDFNTSINSDKTLYAKWTADNEATITFHMDEGIDNYTIEETSYNEDFNIVRQQGSTLSFNVEASSGYSLTRVYAKVGSTETTIPLDGDHFTYTVPSTATIDIYTDTVEEPTTHPSLTFDPAGGEFPDTQVDGNASNDDVTVTVGTGTIKTQETPIYNYFDHGCSETLYNKNELGRVGNIKKIGFDINTASTKSTSVNIKVWMKHVSGMTSFSSTNDWITGLTDNDLYYDGLLNISQTRYDSTMITLSKEFNYNGNDSLLVVVSRSGNWDVGLNFNSTQTTGVHKSLCKGEDGDDYKNAANPNDTTTVTPQFAYQDDETTGTEVYTNMRFIFGEGGGGDTLTLYPKFGTTELYENRDWSGLPVSMPVPSRGELYTFAGYQTNDGTKVMNADGTLIPNIADFTDMWGHWIMTSNKTLKAIWNIDPSACVVNFKGNSTGMKSIVAGSETHTADVDDFVYAALKGSNLIFTVNMNDKYAINTVKAVVGGVTTSLIGTEKSAGVIEFTYPIASDTSNVEIDLTSVYSANKTASVTFNGNGGVYQNPDGTATTKEIGDGTSTSYSAPMNTYTSTSGAYRSSSSCEMIYPGSSVGTGWISSISFWVGSRESQTSNKYNVGFYFGRTTKTELYYKSDWVTDLTYMGALTGSNMQGSSTGWWTVTFNQPYFFDSSNNNNLVVAIARQSQTATSNRQYPQYRYTTTTSTQGGTIMYTGDTSSTTQYYDPRTYTSSWGLYYSNNRPNVQLGVTAGLTTKGLYAGFGNKSIYSDSAGTSVTTIPTLYHTGYVFNGYWTTSSGGYQVIAANGSIIPNVEGYTNAAGEYIMTTGKNLYARWSTSVETYFTDGSGGGSGGHSPGQDPPNAVVEDQATGVDFVLEENRQR